MANPFVWFDNSGDSRDETAKFLAETFGWKTQEVGPNIFLSEEGRDVPFGLTGPSIEGVSGWIPYVEVNDLKAETAKAVEAGGTVVAEEIVGPAGTATFVRDPGDAVIALWQKGAEMMLAHLLSVIGFVFVTLLAQGVSHFALNKDHYKSIAHLRPDPIVPLGLSAAAVQGLLMSLALSAWRGDAIVVIDGLWVAGAFGLFLSTYISFAEPSKYAVPNIGKWMRVELSTSFVQFALAGLLLGLIHSWFSGNLT